MKQLAASAQKGPLGICFCWFESQLGRCFRVFSFCKITEEDFHFFFWVERAFVYMGRISCCFYESYNFAPPISEFFMTCWLSFLCKSYKFTPLFFTWSCVTLNEIDWFIAILSKFPHLSFKWQKISGQLIKLALLRCLYDCCYSWRRHQEVR